MFRNFGLLNAGNVFFAFGELTKWFRDLADLIDVAMNTGLALRG
jgi:hypothetical protein